MSPQDLGEIVLEPGQTIVVVGAKPVAHNRDKKTQTRVRVTDPRPYVEPPVDPPPPPPPPPTVTGIFGPSIACDGKDNAEVGRSDNQHWGIIWHCRQGGALSSLSVTQRYGPDQSDPGKGYAHGDGGLYRITLQGLKADGVTPNGVIYSDRTFKPTRITEGEKRDLLPAGGTIPAGIYVWVWDNIHADPVNNWFSLNFVFNPQAKPQPGTDSAVVYRSNGTGGAWRLVPNNTPTFQVTFADGHVEGQGYGSIIANTDLDGSGQFSGFQMQGARKVRQQLIAPRDLIVKAAWLRVKRLSGSGALFCSIGAVAGQADVSSIPATAKSDLNGGVWVRVPLTVDVKAGEVILPTFSTSAVLDVMPIRKDGQEQDGWKVPGTPGYAQKSMDGSSWTPLYNTGTDLQMYLELA